MIVASRTNCAAQVDHKQHADMLNQLGVDPQELLSHVRGPGGGRLASEAENLLGDAGLGRDSQ